MVNSLFRVVFLSSDSEMGSFLQLEMGGCSFLAVTPAVEPAPCAQEAAVLATLSLVQPTVDAGRSQPAHRRTAILARRRCSRGRGRAGSTRDPAASLHLLVRGAEVGVVIAVVILVRALGVDGCHTGAEGEESKGQLHADRCL